MIRQGNLSDCYNLSILGKKTYYDTYEDIMDKDLIKLTEKIFAYKNICEYMRNDNIMYFVTYLNKKLIGYCKLLFSGKDVTLDKLYVDKIYQGQKYGSKIMDYVLNFLRKNNIESMNLLVYEHNNAAIKFYEKLGFIKKQKKRYSYLDYESNYYDIVMVKRLVSK